MTTKFDTDIKDWLQTIPPQDRPSEVMKLVSRLWALKRDLDEGHKPDPNRVRKQKARSKELDRFVATLRRNSTKKGGDTAAFWAREEEAYREKCRHAGLAGIYVPVIERPHSPFQAVFLLPDGTYATPAATKPIYTFGDLHASLSLPRVPVAAPLDPAYLITDF